jgi:hypothetical protein
MLLITIAHLLAMELLQFQVATSLWTFSSSLAVAVERVELMAFRMVLQVAQVKFLTHLQHLTHLTQLQ